MVVEYLENRVPLDAKRLAEYFKESGFSVGNNNREGVLVNQFYYQGNLHTSVYFDIQDPTLNKKRGKFFGLFRRKVLDVGLVQADDSEIRIEIFGRNYQEKIKQLAENFARKTSTLIKVTLMEDQPKVRWYFPFSYYKF